MTSVSNGTGTWTYAYSTSGTTETTTVTDPLGHTRTVVSNLSIDEVTADTDAYGHTTTYAYDTYGRLTQVTYPEGNYTQYVYDARGNVTQTTKVAKSLGLANIVTSASYDATCTYAVKCNKPNSTTDALGNVTNYTYSTVHGGVLTVTGPAGANGVQPQIGYSYSQIPTYALNSSGTLVQAGSIWQLTAVSTCATSAATFTVTSTTTTTTCAAGASDEIIKTTSYAGSNNALPTSVTTAAGDGSLSATTTTTYDNFGNVIATTNPLGATTNYIYDADRELVATVAPQLTSGGVLKSRAAYTTYTPDGLASTTQKGTVSSASGLTAQNFAQNFTLLEEDSISYDGVDRKIQDSLISGGATQNVVQYSYDAANRLTCTAVRLNPSVFSSLPSSACTQGTTGANGPDQITYDTYDNDNRIIQVAQGYGTSAQINERTLTYSPNGNLLTAADAKGNLTTSAYDGFDRLSAVYYPTPSNGSVSSTTDYEQYSYDADSHLIQDRRRDGQVNTLTRDNLGRVTAVNLPTRTTYAYDNLSRLTMATTTGNGQSLTYTFDALSRQTSEAGAYGSLNFQFDLAGDMTRITWPDGFYAGYVYDAVGEVTQIQENVATSGTGLLAQYTYNDLGERLSLIRGDGVTTSYGYDAAWRLNSLAHSLPNAASNETFSYGYSSANQITSRGATNPAYLWTPSATSTSYTVNGQNQLTQAGSATYGYDGRGNLASDSVNSYAYDAYNNLVTFNSSATMQSDPVGRLMEVTDLSGGSATTSSRWFRYGGSQLLAEYGMVGSDNGVLHERYVPGPGVDETVVIYPGVGTATKYWTLTDERGSVIADLDINGNVQTINTYDDYGVPSTSNWGRMQYTGQMWIPETGLYHYKARDYSPTLGRFMQTDPIGYGDGMNWYAYVHNDPINGTDPSGTGDGSGDCDGCVSGPPIIVTAIKPSTTEGGGSTPFSGDGGVIIAPKITLSPPNNQSTTCTGSGRALKGNLGLVGQAGGIPGQTVQPGTAAVIPQQFGFANGRQLAPYASSIYGSVGGSSFKGITDVIGGKSPIAGVPVRQALQQLNPGEFIVEIPGGTDQGYNSPAPATVTVPPGVGCPTGTSPSGG